MIWNQGGKARAFPSFFVWISLELWGIRSAAQQPELLKNIDNFAPFAGDQEENLRAEGNGETALGRREKVILEAEKRV